MVDYSAASRFFFYSGRQLFIWSGATLGTGQQSRLGRLSTIEKTYIFYSRHSVARRSPKNVAGQKAGTHPNRLQITTPPKEKIGKARRRSGARLAAITQAFSRTKKTGARRKLFGGS